MKTTSIITAAAVCLTMATPVAAHHLCDSSSVGLAQCPEEIGDVMGTHEETFEEVSVNPMDPETGLTQDSLDPANSTGGVDYRDVYYGEDGPASNQLSVPE